MPSASPNPVPRRKRISDERILDAACAEFARVGYEAAAFDRVAVAAGTTRTTLYTRFGSKAALLEAVMARVNEELEDRLLAAYGTDESVPLDARLERYVSAYFEYARERPDAFKLLFLTELLPSGTASTIEHVTSRIAELFAHGEGRDEVTDEDRLVASLIIGSVHFGAGAAAASGGVAPERAAELTRRFLARGVRMRSR